jgi:hypothetical protein
MGQDLRSSKDSSNSCRAKLAATGDCSRSDDTFCLLLQLLVLNRSVRTALLLTACTLHCCAKHSRRLAALKLKTRYEQLPGTRTGKWNNN